MKSKAGIYEIISSDGTRTYLHATSQTGARKSVGGPKREINRVADSWQHWQKIKAEALQLSK